MKKLSALLLTALTLSVSVLPVSAGTQQIKQDTTFTGTVTVPNGSFTRAKLATESAVSDVLLIPNAFRNDDGSIIAAAASSGKMGITSGGHGTGGIKLVGEAAQNNTKTDYFITSFMLPPNYVAGSAITIKFTAKYSGSGTAGTKTLDMEAYKLAKAGTVGSDLCSTTVQTITSSSVEYSFTVTPTGLVAGDKVQIIGTLVVQETGNVSTLTGEVSDARACYDIKG